MTGGQSAGTESPSLVRDVLHLVASPPGALVRGVVTDNLRSTDRLRWYPSLLLEGYDEDPMQQALADDATLLGVPVVTTRSRRGLPGVDDVRMFFDDWFYVRNTYPSLVHVHATSTSLRSSSARWLSPVLRRIPLVVSVYPTDEAGDPPGFAAVEVRRAGRRVSHGRVDLPALREANWLYDAVLAKHRRR